MWRHSSMDALQKRRLSSAKNKWVSLKPFLQIDTPLILSNSAALESKPWSPSVQKRKRYGESRLSCLMSLVGLIISKGSPLRRREYETVVMHSIIKATQSSWKTPTFHLCCKSHQPYNQHLELTFNPLPLW